MTNPVARLRTFETGEQWLYLWCPGCELAHTPVVGGKDSIWTWNGSLESPTISPSLLVRPHLTLNDRGNRVETNRCHSYVREGRWEFLGDSNHELAGQTVDLPPLPDWVVSDG